MRPVTTALFSLVLGAATQAGTWTVHPLPGMGDFLSPAEALASPLVVAGDRLEVLPGTYVGTILVDRALTLVARAGAERTVLDGGGSGPVVTITAGATVQGFTITGAAGPASVGGVLISSAETVHLFHNRIVDNHPGGDVGVPAGGVEITSGSSAVLHDNEIRGNTSLSVGGLVAGGGSTIELFRDRIHGNGGSGTTTGGVLIGASGRLVDVQITGNHGTAIGGLYFSGIFGGFPGETLELTNCTVYGNFGSSPMGSAGGLYLDDGGTMIVRNTVVYANMGSHGMDIDLSPDWGAPPVAGLLDIDYSLTGVPAPMVLPGAHMIPAFTDPELVAPVLATPFGPAPFGNFRPRSTSVLIDTGLDGAFPFDLPEIDADGASRVVGTTIDIGAFERRFKIRPAGAPMLDAEVTQLP
jgi:hypothetical protein